MSRDFETGKWQASTERLHLSSYVNPIHQEIRINRQPVILPWLMMVPGKATRVWIILFKHVQAETKLHYFADQNFKLIFSYEKRILIKNSLKFVSNDSTTIKSAFVQIMAWHLSGDNSFSKTMMSSLLKYICITRPRWVKRVHSSTAKWRKTNWANAWTS